MSRPTREEVANHLVLGAAGAADEYIEEVFHAYIAALDVVEAARPHEGITFVTPGDFAGNLVSYTTAPCGCAYCVALRRWREGA